MALRAQLVRALAVVSGLLFAQGCVDDPLVSSPGAAGSVGQAGAAAGAGVGGAGGSLGAGVAAVAGAGAGTGGSGETAGMAGVAGATGGASGAGAGGSAGAAGNSGAGGTGGVPPVMLDDTLRARVAAGMVPLQAWYNQSTGLFDKNDWWTSGNQLEAVIDYTRETGDMQYFGDIENTFVKNEASKFDRHGFYDDDGWWALVWIKAYDLAGEEKYLAMAKTIFARMAGSWDTKCGGGIYWRNAKDKKNAIPNTLFMQAAARLHLRTPGDTQYLDWSERTWNWFKASGMLQGSKLILDTLNNLTDCDATGPVFTYNQGVALGALVDLAQAKGDSALLDEAEAVARATMTMMQVNGILKEAPCGGEVCTQFKGIFMRNLLLYYRARPAKDVQTYMRRQSDQIWDVSRNDNNQFGYEWHLPFDGVSVMRHASALEAMTSAYASSNPLP